jgi:hypothetical protein
MVYDIRYRCQAAGCKENLKLSSVTCNLEPVTVTYVIFAHYFIIYSLKQ